VWITLKPLLNLKREALHAVALMWSST
jgi:hypothetical protein